MSTFFHHRPSKTLTKTVEGEKTVTNRGTERVMAKMFKLMVLMMDMRGTLVPLPVITGDHNEETKERKREPYLPYTERRLKPNLQWSQTPTSSISSSMQTPPSQKLHRRSWALEAEAAAMGLITQFLTLPTVATRVSRQSKDPIMDFNKSIMLTSD